MSEPLYPSRDGGPPAGSFSPKSSPRGCRSPMAAPSLPRHDSSTGTLKMTISAGKHPAVVNSGPLTPFYLMKVSANFYTSAWRAKCILCYGTVFVCDEIFLVMLARFQLRICRPPPLSFDPTFMKDAQCAELNKNQFSNFYFLSYRENSSKIDSF